MDVAITRISSKGQVVIPARMRHGFNEGDELIMFRNKDQLIMKQASKLDKNFQEDMEFARKTEEAWKRISAGKGTKMGFDDFIDEMKKW
ncbi:AbrB family transcriptional regulator [Candidatus Woesearchaeota archaeon CG_4_10_14_0_8_um_filter_47_5]|nr:MAG: AbrB family transcriptional regulator [Candidatus Woesearchaeota archaeon CG_4_10_14_0_8_um_filter_47_5]